MVKSEKDELLLEITQKLGLNCLSDLRYIRDQKQLKKVLILIPSEKYRLSEWRDAAGYIGSGLYQGSKNFQTPEEAKNYLIKGEQ